MGASSAIGRSSGVVDTHLDDKVVAVVGLALHGALHRGRGGAEIHERILALMRSDTVPVA